MRSYEHPSQGTLADGATMPIIYKFVAEQSLSQTRFYDRLLFSYFDRMVVFHGSQFPQDRIVYPTIIIRMNESEKLVEPSPKIGDALLAGVNCSHVSGLLGAICPLSSLV